MFNGCVRACSRQWTLAASAPTCYSRLSIFPILIPALRDRQEDIPALANRFLEKYSTLQGKRIVSIEHLASLYRGLGLDLSSVNSGFVNQ